MQEQAVKFSRTEYVENSGQVKQGAFVILPQKEFKPKSFIVGHQKGRLSLYKPLHGYVHGEQLKHTLSKPIQSVEIGGWGKDFRDRIFFTEGDTIIGQTKRNVVMFQKHCDFMNNMMRKLWVEDHYIWIFTNKEICEIYSKTYSFNVERNAHYYSKQCEMNDFLIMQPQQRQYYALACAQDKFLRLISKSEAKHEFQLANIPTHAKIDYRVPWVAKPNTYQSCTVGLDNGKIVGIETSLEGGIQTSYYMNPSNPGPIANYQQYDIQLNGKKHFLSAQKSGQLEYFCQNINGEMDSLWQTQVQQVALDVDGGQISDVNYNEYLVSNESGKIYGFGEKIKRNVNIQVNTAINKKKEKKLKKIQDPTEEEGEKESEELKDGGSPKSNQQKLEKLQKQIETLSKNYTDLQKEKKKKDEDLRKSLMVEKKQSSQEEQIIGDDDDDKIKLSDDEDNIQENNENDDGFDQFLERTDVEGVNSKKKRKNIKPWILKHELSGNEEDGSLELLLISENPINMIAINSEVMDIIYVKPNSVEAKLSINEDTINKNKNCVFQFLKDDIFEYTIKMFSREGNHGNLKVFVVCQNDLQFSQYINIYVNPLYMHRLMEQPVSEEYLLNSLTITGQIGSNDIYSWFNVCIQDFEMNNDDDFNNICFENPFMQTYVLIKFDGQSCILYSDSISILQSLKLIVTEQTNLRGKQVDIKWDISGKSLKRNLKFLRNKIREHKRILDQQVILEGLNDLKTNEEDMQFLSDDFKEILNSKNDIEEALKNMPKNLDYLKQMVVNLYSDYSQLKGSYDYVDKIDQLKKLLDKYKYKQIFELMNVVDN